MHLGARTALSHPCGGYLPATAMAMTAHRDSPPDLDLVSIRWGVGVDEGLENDPNFARYFWREFVPITAEQRDAADPSEAVRSADIIPVLRRVFPRVEIRYTPRISRPISIQVIRRRATSCACSLPFKTRSAIREKSSTMPTSLHSSGVEQRLESRQSCRRE